MAEFKNKEEYDKWKAEKIKASQEKLTEKTQEIPKEELPVNQVNPSLNDKVPMSEPIKRIKCKHCAMIIPKEALICPYCRKKQVGGHLVLKILLAGFVMIFLIPYCVGVMNKNTSTQSASSDYYAYSACKEFVTSRLKAPSSADFASYADSKVRPTAESLFVVTSYVDAQNSFGAKLRTPFLCLIKHEDGSWNLINLEMSNQ